MKNQISSCFLLCSILTLIGSVNGQTFDWAKQFGGSYDDKGWSVSTDASGNVYTTGSFRSTVDFDPGTGTFNLYAFGLDAFISKLDSAGNFVWAKHLGGSSSNCTGNAISIDGYGNVYITGEFLGTVDFNPGAGTFNLSSGGNNYSTFICKLDASGSFLWAKHFESSGDLQVESITIDDSGNVYSTGSFPLDADFDPGVGTYILVSHGGGDIFISKLNASGDFLWAKQIGGAAPDHGFSITTDSSGNVYTIGEFQDSVDFDPGAGTFNLISTGSEDVFISKLDSSGSFVWAKSFGGIGNDIGYSITTDDNGNIYSTGGFALTADLDPGASTFNLTSQGIFDAFVSKLDPSGHFLWAKQLGEGIGSVIGFSITIDSSNNIYTTGSFQDSADFDPGATVFNLTSYGNRDIFISKLDSSGNFLWAKQMGGTGNDYGRAINTDAFGNIYSTGSFENTSDFDPGAGSFNFTSLGNRDAYVHKLRPCSLMMAPVVVSACDSFTWIDSITYTSSTNSPTFTLLESGGCDTIVTLDLTIQSAPHFPTDDTLLCTGDTLLIDVSAAGGSYLWHDNSTDSVFAATMQDTVWVIVSNACGTLTDSMYVRFTDVPELPHLDSILCSSVDYEIDLTTDSNSSFLWNNGDSSALDTIDTSGVHWVHEWNICGSDSDTFSVSFEDSIAIDLGPDTILCEGDTIEMNNPWQYDLLWSTSDTTSGIQILAADTYWLQVTNACGVFSDTIIVDSIITAFVEFGIDDTLLCEGESLLIDATVEQGTYLWHDGSTDSVFYATGPDTIWVEALNVCNITPATDTMIVRFTDIPVIPELDSVLCSGQSYFIDLTTDSVSQFVWYDGHTGAFDTITFQNTYWVKEWNVCGHDSSDFMVAFVSDPQTLLGDDTVLCISDSMVLDASTPFGKYVWNTGDTSGAIVVDESYLSGDSNHYIVTVYNACKSDTDDVIIAADYYLDMDLGDDQLVCLDDSVTIDAGDFPRTDYKWSPSQNGEHQFGFSAQQDVTQSVTASNACGAFSDTIVISVDQPLIPELGDDRIVCFGDTVVLGVEDLPRTDFRWSSRPNVLTQPDDGSSITMKAGSSQLPGDTVTTYIITLSNECGPTSDSVHIQVDSLPELFAIDSIYFCEDSFATVHIVKSDIDYLEWQDGSREVRRKIDEQASWPVTFYNHCGSTEQRLFSVRKLPPHIQLDSPQKICEHILVLEPVINKGEPTSWSPQNQMNYLWSDGSTLNELVVDHPGHYGVTITNAFGCYDSARVQVKTCGSDWYIPNAFTPSGDGHNDLWRPKGEGFYNYTITIFDRWGNAVYTFDDQSPGWDGTVGNQPVSGGVYTYNMTVFSEDFPKGRLVNGTVMVVR